MENEAKIALEDGTIIKGEGFGHETTATGEVVFSTGMTGYVEALTDPSFKGQILMSTYPLQGNYGVDEEWYQSSKIQTEGFIVREVCKQPSAFSSQKTLDEFLREFKIPGISGIDTRDLTIKIREKGAMKCAMATEEIDDSELQAMARNQLSIVDMDLVPQVSTKETVVFGENFKRRVAIIDCGVKKNIINGFLKRNIGVALFPYDTDYKNILDCDVDGLMISCGPGNPSRVTETIDTMKKISDKLPIFGICMGQQIIAKSFGAKIYKMKFGHRGANQPVKDLASGKVFITSQNHGFTVDADSLKDIPLELTQINLNDGTPEGFSHEELPLQCVQYHPEAGPGPNDTSFVFDRFKQMMDDY
ncbi:carbamoyl-phosphate synthase small chain [Methanobrevibacter cuticularis]|uniref:Carbamoyl phosphate synthase small chain n=1 Tax=Methanobrevibacter cuticularis TaxID=47311 RepID=A0A166D496_9EURY|nr:glutamine-hydrolyzing carbamoyl-phosphate synthase small subunit [Methanobrevibacter cuticularis]KZX15191.1 carbamoyl-phosphate synthase small chain [Methanobrevibacter cuticularis]